MGNAPASDAPCRFGDHHAPVARPTQPARNCTAARGSEGALSRNGQKVCGVVLEPRLGGACGGFLVIHAIECAPASAHCGERRAGSVEGVLDLREYWVVPEYRR